MLISLFRLRMTNAAAAARLAVLAACAVLALAFSAPAQQPATPSANPQTAEPPAQSNDAQTPVSPAAAAAAPAPTPSTLPVPDAMPVPNADSAAPQVPPPQGSQVGGMNEVELKQLLVGKALYLRGGYLNDSLSFDEHGRLIGHSPQGSYTLSAIEIEKVRLTKHKVELEGARYGLHFLGQLAFEDPSSAFDRVRITPKKKDVKITIDREIVVNPKKKKEPSAGKNKKGKPAASAKPAPTSAAELNAPATAPATTPADATPTPVAPTPAAAQVPTTAASAAPQLAPQAQLAPPQVAQVAQEPELSEAGQLKASIAAAPVAERPADPGSVTTTISPAHATKLLKDALDQIFAQGLDDRMMASMPDFWKLYYQAVASKADYRPQDPSILRQNMVDQKAVLLTKFEPDSNDFAQANGVAGMAQYHAVIGADGKVGEVAVSRPIGFGLDENAVATIRKATFQPAIKDGKPVAVMLDLNVAFRIFSKRTNAHSSPEPASNGKPAEPVLPGPYSVPHS